MMWLLFLPFVILAVLVLVAGGILSALGPAWPLLLVGFGIWLLVRGDRRARPRCWNMAVPVQVATRPRPTSAASPLGPRRQRATAAPAPVPHPELPIDVRVKVEQIRHKVDVLLGYADRFPPFSRDLYLVRQTASDYLPRTIQAYLSLPSEIAERVLATPEGKTAHEEFLSQLALLDEKLDDIAQDLQRQDLDRLLANRRFLELRFSPTADGPSFTRQPTTDVDAA